MFSITIRFKFYQKNRSKETVQAYFAEDFIMFFPWTVSRSLPNSLHFEVTWFFHCLTWNSKLRLTWNSSVWFDHFNLEIFSIIGTIGQPRRTPWAWFSMQMFSSGRTTFWDHFQTVRRSLSTLFNFKTAPFHLTTLHEPFQPSCKYIHMLDSSFWQMPDTNVAMKWNTARCARSFESFCEFWFHQVPEVFCTKWFHVVTALHAFGMFRQIQFWRQKVDVIFEKAKSIEVQTKKRFADLRYTS